MNSAVLIVDDQVEAISLLAANLASAGYRVLRAADLAQARAQAAQVRPDVVLLFRSLQGLSTLHYVRQLRTDERTAGVALVMIGMAAEHPHDAVAALESGADDYLTEPFEVNELLARIKAVMRRRAPHRDDDVVEIEGLRFDPAAHRVSACGQVLQLRAIEFRLLHFFMTHPDRLVGRGRLLDEVWGDDICVEERSVDIHVRRLRQVLQGAGHAGRLETLRGYGYRFLSRLAAAVATTAPAIRRQAPGASREIRIDPTGLGLPVAAHRQAPSPRLASVERHEGDASC